MRTPFFFPRASSRVLNRVLFQWIRWSCRQTDRPGLGACLQVEDQQKHQLGMTEDFQKRLLCNKRTLGSTKVELDPVTGPRPDSRSD